MALLTRQQIEAALARLDVELGRHGQRASFHLVGGAVMCLVFRAREATRDVDGWFDEPGVVPVRRQLQSLGHPLVGQYYAAHHLPVRTQLLLEEIFHDRS